MTISLLGRAVTTMVQMLGGMPDAAAPAELEAWRIAWRDLQSLYDNEHLEVTHRWAQQSHPLRSAEWYRGGGQGYRFFALTSMVCNRLGATFNRPPELYLHRGDHQPLDPQEPEARQWQLDQDDMQLPMVLQSIERRLHALKQLAVMPAMVRGRMRWRVYGPHELEVVCDEEDPADLRHAPAVAIEVRRRTTSSSQSYFNVWTYDEQRNLWGYRFVDIDGRGARTDFFADGRNMYARHPVVMWRSKLPNEGETFAAPDEVLLHNQLGCNIALTDLNFGLKYQVHPQLIEFGKTIEHTGDVYGPNTVKRYNDKNSEGLEYKTPALNLAEYRETIEWWTRMYTVSEGLPPDTFSANSSTRNLGAKQHESLELQVRREAQRPLLEGALRETFEVHKVVSNYWADQGVGGRTRYGDDIQLGVRLKPIPQVTDRATSVQADAAETAEGLNSVVEREMEASGSSRQQAEATIRLRRESAA
ncbi:MAG: hypothetical protein IV100_17790 [Myxococcales bacterium]|nr:hypothetical protein [Myxococcales bacterium]